MTRVPLPRAYFDRPIAHRGLHSIKNARAENSRKAFAAAIESGYGIELDLQLSSDGVAMVFHDYDLGRLTSESGAVARRTATELSRICLSHDGDGIPTLSEVLEQVHGQVPLLVELKDQDGAMGPNIGRLERAAAEAIASYDGLVALMSFNPHSVAMLNDLLPNVPRGLVTCDFNAEDWPTVPETRRVELAPIPDFERTNSSFISHDRADLTSSYVADLKSKGTPVLCWTIRSPEQETEARKVADNITFEGYLA